MLREKQTNTPIETPTSELHSPTSEDPILAHLQEPAISKESIGNTLMSSTNTQVRLNETVFTVLRGGVMEISKMVLAYGAEEEKSRIRHFFLGQNIIWTLVLVPEHCSLVNVLIVFDTDMNNNLFLLKNSKLYRSFITNCCWNSI